MSQFRAMYIARSNTMGGILYQVTKVTRKSFPVTDSSEILEKFPRIGPQDKRFLGDHSFETQFRQIPEKLFGIFPYKIPQNFFGILLRKFLRNSLDLVTNFTDFYGN